MNKKTASSLAEVMIALIIIGVVAGLTVPVMKKETQRQEYATKLKKGYLALEQSIDAAIVDEGDIENNGAVRWNMAQLFSKYIKPEMQIAKDCSGVVQTCMAPSAGASDAIILLDGIAIGNSDTTFYIDVNNSQPPNIPGVDLYEFSFEKVGGVSPDADYKFVPIGDAKKVMEAGWKITHW